MKDPVLLPQLGLTMTEGTVSEWLKKPGDQIRKGEMLFVVSTDKADMEVESLAEGTLAEIVVEVGRTVPVGTVIAYLERSGEQTFAASVSTEAATPKAAPQESGAKDSTDASTAAKLELHREARRASPRARRVARELNVDISTVRGTGVDRRITEADVRRTVEPAPTVSGTPDVRRRQLIAEKMAQSVQTIPDFSLCLEVNAERLVSSHEILKRQAEKEPGPRLTLTDLLVKAMGVALVEVPAMNSAWEEGRIVERSTVDIGVAIATERGVVSPVIRQVDKLDLAAIVTCRSDLVERSRKGRLALSDLEGGIGTLSNLGMYEVDHFQAIINPDQTFILAVGCIRNRPWVEDTTLTVRPTLMLTLSVDHRVVDGAKAALFLTKLASLIDKPSRLTS